MNKKAIIKILDEVNVVFIGLKTTDIDYLYDKFGLHAVNYIFHPKYKLGTWDGKIRFFSKTGKTYLQLVPEIVKYLKKQSYKFKLIDKRHSFDVELPVIDDQYLIDNGITLAKHQVKGVNALTQNGGGIFIGGTGAGKTICAAALSKLYHEELNLRIIIIVPNADLITQTIEEIKEFIDVGEYSGNKKDLDHPCVVSTWQALQHNKAILSKFQVAIVDECHGVKATVLKDMLNQHGTNIYVKIGVTGTLPEEEIDKMSVRVSLGNVVHEVPAHELIKNKWLAKLNLHVTQLKEDLSEWYEEYFLSTKDSPKMTYAKFKQNAFPDFTSEKNYLQTNAKRNEELVSMFQEMRNRKKGNTFILVNGIAYGKRLAKLIPDAHFVYGADKKDVRQEIYNLFKENDNVLVISTFSLASTGLNIKRIFNLVLLDAGKSFIQVIQSIGRGLRKAHDKDEVNVYDICGDLKYSRRHLSKRTKHYSNQNYEFTKEKVDY